MDEANKSQRIDFIFHWFWLARKMWIHSKIFHFTGNYVGMISTFSQQNISLPGNPSLDIDLKKTYYSNDFSFCSIDLQFLYI